MSRFYRKILSLPLVFLRTLIACRKFKPDVFVGQAIPFLGISSLLRDKPFIIYEDTEHVDLLHKFILPLCTKFITPESFRKRKWDLSIVLSRDSTN